MSDILDFEELVKDAGACKALLESDPREWVKIFLDHYGCDVDDLRYGTIFLNGFGIRSVHEEGDTEGEGEHSEVVFEVTVYGAPSGVFFRFNGHYTSHYGTEWDESWSLVEPRQVTETRYFDK